jgi:hypothetical protein
MENLFLGDRIYGVAGVRSANAHKDVILGGEVRDDVSLPFASVLPSHDDVYKLRYAGAVETQPTSHSREHIVRAAANRINDDVRKGVKRFDLGFGRVSPNRVVRRRFTEIALSSPIAFCKIFERSC